MRVLVFYLLLIQSLISGPVKFGNDQIIIMLKEYFISSKTAPLLMGHQFYSDRDKMIFQIEIKTNPENVNNALLFGFKAINDLAGVSKVNFTHSILVIHFNNNALPVIAESNLECSRFYFLDGKENEAQWRKNCLTIQNY